MNPENESVLPYPGEFPVVGKVEDLDSGGGISGYRFNLSSRWEDEDSYTLIDSFMTNSSGLNSTLFEPQQKGNITFELEIPDNDTQFYTAEEPVTRFRYQVKDIEAPVIRNATAEPDRDLEANTDETEIRANVTDNYGIREVWANVSLENGTHRIVKMDNMTPVRDFGSGERAVYAANYTPSTGGNHSIEVYAQDKKPEKNTARQFASYLEVFGQVSIDVGLEPQAETATGITQESGYNFTAQARFTNTGNATAYVLNLSHSESPIDTVYYNDTRKECGSIESGDSCNWTFTVNVPEATLPQIIEKSVHAVWRNPDRTVDTQRNDSEITVSSNPQPRIEAREVNEEEVPWDDPINATAPHGLETVLGTTTTVSYGNEDLQELEIDTVGGNLFSDCPNCSLTVFPDEQGTLSPGDNFSSDVQIDVPSYQDPGNYWTKLRVETDNAGDDDILLNATVPVNGSWNHDPSTFGKLLIQPGESGFIGNISTSNIGNVKIPLQIFENGNGTAFTESYPFGAPGTDAYDLAPGASRNVTVEYSVPEDVTEGLYSVDIIKRNVTIGEPPERVTSLKMNITDVGPSITDVEVDPQRFEVLHGEVNISAEITDNFDVDRAWINVTRPVNRSWGNSTSVSMMNNTVNSTYTDDYSATVNGTHALRICANSTNPTTGLTSDRCTDPINLSAEGTTEIEPVLGTVSADNVTIISDQNISIRPLVNNTGPSRTNSTNLTVEEESPVLDTNVTDISIGDMLGHASEEASIELSVESGTSPGNHSFNLTTEWLDLLDSRGNNLSEVTVEVEPNRRLDAVSSPTAKIEEGANDTVSFDIESTGNVNVSNVSVTCDSGVPCENFTVTEEPEGFNLSLADTREIDLEIEVPQGIKKDIYTGNLSFRSEGEEVGRDTLTVNVPINISWVQSPGSVSEAVLSGEEKVMETVEMENTGNDGIRVDASQTGNISQYIDIPHPSFYLPFNGVNRTNVTVSVPMVDDYTTFTGTLSTDHPNATRTETTDLELLAVPFFTDITEPRASDRRTGLQTGDNFSARVNVSFGRGDDLRHIGDNVAFDAALQNETETRNLEVVEKAFNDSENLWNLTLEANGTEAYAYDLNVTADHTGVDDRSRHHVRTDVTSDSVVMADNSSPVVDVSLPIEVSEGSKVTAEFNVTETGVLNTSSVEGSILTPNGTSSFSPALMDIYRDRYSFQHNFTDTDDIGTYEINLTACDISSNCQTGDGDFSIFRKIGISGVARDLEDVENDPPEPIDSQFLFKDPPTGTVLQNFSSNASTGEYNSTVRQRTYDFEYQFFNSYFRQTDISVSEEIIDPVGVGDIAVGKAGGPGTSNAVYMQSNLSGNDTHVFVRIPEDSDFDTDNSRMFRCDSWVPASEGTTQCNSSWTEVSDASLTDNKGWIYSYDEDISDGVAYAIGPYFVGDGACDSEFGESNDVSPNDCEDVVGGGGDIGGGEGGAGGGGGGDGGGGGTGEGEGTGGGGGGAGDEIEIPPVEPTEPTEPTEPGPDVSGQVPLQVRSSLVNLQLNPGQTKTFSASISNNEDAEKSASISLQGSVFNVLTLQQNSITIPPLETRTILIRGTATEDTGVGTYTGSVLVDSEDVTHRLPVSVEVVPEEEALLDVLVNPLSIATEPGGNFTFEYTLKNRGQTVSVRDITMDFQVHPLNEPDNVVTQISRTVAVNDTETKRERMSIPEDVPEGRYVVSANASYANFQKEASAAESFEVSSLPLPLVMLRMAAFNPITYIVLFVLLPLLILGVRWVNYYRSKKKAQERYVAPLDMSKLPQEGEDTIRVGNIAERDVPAYMDIEQLKVHSIAAGGTGSGKSVSAQVVSEQLLKRGDVSIVVFDPTDQWTGMLKPNELDELTSMFPDYDLDPEDAPTGFKTTIVQVDDPDQEIDVWEALQRDGEITVFEIGDLEGGELDDFVRSTIDKIFEGPLDETTELQSLVIYDEVHRLLPKYGGKGGYVKLEQAAREFRKWGIGVFLISQVLTDFRGELRANIANEIQLRTKYSGDVRRVRSKHGKKYAERVPGLEIGTGLFHNPEYNQGRPWFIDFRPPLHSPFALDDEELDRYLEIKERIDDLREEIEDLKEEGVDTYDVETELDLAEDKLKTANYTSAETYVESLETRIDNMT
ncbi:MAG: DUF87 domain-containing protein [Candidatus Nanohaloarchaeota archaeon QJJ-7]|nr:DUF87 domain-containing protein [Candidatus Nanohaloarchaeota archaeon QJJ-7]